MPKLVKHLLPRVKDNFCKELRESNNNGEILYQWDFDAGNDKLLFKNDRLYRHRIFRINYTTYDVQRVQDVINPHTPHRDIMVLNSVDGTDNKFSYARVLSIYHADVIYANANGAYQIHKPQRIEFFIKSSSAISPTWDTLRLDRLTFPSVADDDALDFLDPANVLRACHIVPRISLSRVHQDGIGVSRCANDKEDWERYYVNR